jgi:hypothetical protein
VLLTLVPLIVAGAVTLEVMVLLGEPLNFANVIALPLLLGVGVALSDRPRGNIEELYAAGTGNSTNVRLTR